MSQKSKKYLKSLRTKALEYERKDINGQEAKGFFRKYARRILCFVVTSGVLILLPTGFGYDFIELTATILSIFVGLFITALIFAFDKFYVPKKMHETQAQVKVKETQSYNYYKQFTYLIGFNIVTSVFVLILLLINVIFLDSLALNVREYHFQFDLIDSVAIMNFLMVAGVLLFRFVIIYNVATIFHITVFMVSSMVEFMVSKVDFEKRTIGR